MDFIKGKINYVAGLMVLGGILSIVLNFIDYNLRALMWIDQWGDGLGWVIRIAFIIGGAVLYVFSTSTNNTSKE